MRSLRSFEVFLPPEWISSKTGQSTEEETKAKMDIHQEKM
jgi:hypothetical protein